MNEARLEATDHVEIGGEALLATGGMTRPGVSESIVEDAALNWLERRVWQIVHGLDIAPDTPSAERADYSEVVLVRCLRDALVRMTGAVHSSKRWPRPHAPAVSLRRIGECLKHMIALDGVMASKSSGW